MIHAGTGVHGFNPSHGFRKVGRVQRLFHGQPVANIILPRTGYTRG